MFSPLVLLVPISQDSFKNQGGYLWFRGEHSSVNKLPKRSRNSNKLTIWLMYFITQMPSQLKSCSKSWAENSILTDALFSMTWRIWFKKKRSNNFLILLPLLFYFNAPPYSKTGPGVVIYLQPKLIRYYCCVVHSDTEWGCLSNGIQTNSL